MYLCSVKLNNMKSPHITHGNKFQFNTFNIQKLTETHYRMGKESTMIRWPVNSFLFLSEGEIFIQIEDTSTLMLAGEMIIIPANVPTVIKYYNNTAGYMGGFSNDFITDLSQNIIDKFNYLQYHNTHKFIFDYRQLDRINDLLRTLNVLFKSENEALMKAYLLCLLQELAVNEGEAIINNDNNPITKRFLETLFNPESVTLKPHDYAHKLCVSVNHLNKVIRQTTSKSVSEWIEERLIVNAKILLNDNNLSIADVADKLNITDQSYFARKFKQKTGLSASDYRKQDRD